MKLVIFELSMKKQLDDAALQNLRHMFGAAAEWQQRLEELPVELFQVEVEAEAG